MSKVYFVGCGPGDPDLITVKAKKLIQKADVVVYSGSLIPSEILKMCKKARMYDAAKLVREEIFDLLKKNAKKGKRVVRLHDGDPSIYGAIREQMDNLHNEKIDSVIVPGVTSFLALTLIHISEPTRRYAISYVVFCLKKKTHPSSPSFSYPSLHPHPSTHSLISSFALKKHSDICMPVATNHLFSF